MKRFKTPLLVCLAALIVAACSADGKKEQSIVSSIRYELSSEPISHVPIVSCEGTLAMYQASKICDLPAGRGRRELSYFFPGGKYFSFCGLNAQGFRTFCSVGSFPDIEKPEWIPSNIVRLTSGPTFSVSGFGLIKYVADITTTVSHEFGDGFAKVDFYSAPDFKGSLICSMEIKLEGRATMCAGAGRLARSAKVVGYYLLPDTMKRPSVCFRTALNEEYRCYSRMWVKGYATNDLLIPDLDASVITMPVVVESAKGSIAGKVYSVDYLMH